MELPSRCCSARRTLERQIPYGRSMHSTSRPRAQQTCAVLPQTIASLFLVDTCRAVPMSVTSCRVQRERPTLTVPLFATHRLSETSSRSLGLSGPTWPMSSWLPLATQTVSLAIHWMVRHGSPVVIRVTLPSRGHSSPSPCQLPRPLRHPHRRPHPLRRQHQRRRPLRHRHQHPHRLPRPLHSSRAWEAACRALERVRASLPHRVMKDSLGPQRPILLDTQ